MIYIFEQQHMLPNYWKLMKFGEVADFKNGLNYKAKESGNLIKILGVGDFQRQTQLSNFSEIDTTPLTNIPKKDEFLRNNDLLFVRSNGNKKLVGRCLIVYPQDEKIAYSGFTIRARIKSHEVYPKFIALLMQAGLLKKALKKEGAGTNISNLNQKTLAALEIPLPPLPEQQKIAAILKTWDEAIALTEKLIEEKQKYKKSLMQLLFSGKLRFTKFFNQRWQEMAIENLGQVITGTTPSKNKKFFYGNSYCWATAEDFKNKYIRETAIKLSEVGKKKVRLLPQGSILITCIASIGKNAVAAIELATNQQINAIVVNKSHYNEFVYYLIEANEKKLRTYAGFGSLPILNKKTFEKIRFFIPQTKKEQEKIANLLSITDEEIEHLASQLIQFKIQKNGLMHKLLSGQIRTL